MRWIIMLLALVVGVDAQAQTGSPRAGYVFPACGKTGTTVHVTFGGQSLNGVSDLHISGAGVTAGKLEYVRPPNPGEVQTLREKMNELQQRRADARELGPATRPWTDAEETTLADIRKRLMAFMNRASIPALQETVGVDLTISANAEPGPRQLRLITQNGVTVPLRFIVGTLDETLELDSTKVSVRNEIEVKIPAAVNGRIMAGDIDRIRFSAKKGQRIVASVAARELVPYISDAVPGWFQATARLLDSSNKEIGFNDDYQLRPDPVLVQTIPADGEYVLEIRDALFRGREDFVYRATIGELPLVSSVFPLGGHVGTPNTVDLRGVNLPPTATTRPSSSQPELLSLYWPIKGQRVGPVYFSTDDLPEVADRTLLTPPGVRRAPSTAPTSQPIHPPVIVNGRISAAGERDVYSFEGLAGQQIVADVLARRLGSPLDSQLVLTDANGTMIASADDCADVSYGLMTHHADACIVTTLPRDGTYRLLLADIQDHGGAEYAYRLRVSPPRPDFALRSVPSTLLIRNAMPIVMSVHAIRRDGFAGPIQLKLAGNPRGLLLQGGEIPAGADSVRVTIAATSEVPEGVRPIEIVGVAQIGETNITRIAEPADDWQQAFSYHHFVVADEGLLIVNRRIFGREAPAVLDRVPVQLGEETIVRVRLPQLPMRAGRAGDELKLQLQDPPKGVELRKWRVSGNTVELTIALDASKVAARAQGNLIVEVGIDRQRRAVLGYLPAIPFTLDPKQLAGNSGGVK